MFAVYDNGRPACEEGFPKLKGYGWEEYKFNTLIEAQQHANKWLGKYASIYYIDLDCSYDYSGYGDYIRIEETKAIKSEESLPSASDVSYFIEGVQNLSEAPIYVYIEELKTYMPVKKMGISGTNSPFDKPQILLTI